MIFIIEIISVYPLTSTKMELVQVFLLISFSSKFTAAKSDLTPEDLHYMKQMNNYELNLQEGKNILNQNWLLPNCCIGLCLLMPKSNVKTRFIIATNCLKITKLNSSWGRSYKTFEVIYKYILNCDNLL